MSTGLAIVTTYHAGLKTHPPNTHATEILKLGI